MTDPYWSDATTTIYLGDCREIMPSIAGAALVLADPPYGDTSLGWDRWPDGWIEAIPGDVRQLWCFGSMRMFLDRGHEFRPWTFGQDVIWRKHNGSSFHNDRFRRVHETAVHWYRDAWSTLTIHPQFSHDATARTIRRKTKPTHTGPIDDASYQSIDGGPRLVQSVLEVRSMHGKAIHPTEKPLGILEPLIRYSTNPGDLILDPTAGSCSTRPRGEGDWPPVDLHRSGRAVPRAGRPRPRIPARPLTCCYKRLTCNYVCYARNSRPALASVASAATLTLSDQPGEAP